MKSRDPRIDPCRMPCFILPHRRDIIIMKLSIYYYFLISICEIGKIPNDNNSLHMWYEGE